MALFGHHMMQAMHSVVAPDRTVFGQTDITVFTEFLTDAAPGTGIGGIEAALNRVPVNPQ